MLKNMYVFTVPLWKQGMSSTYCLVGEYNTVC